jgi:hypothetical protein
MTTLVGLITKKGKKSVILGADRSVVSGGDCGGEDEQMRGRGQKIYIDDKRTFAVCMTGIYDNLYKEFLASFLSGGFDLEKITHEGMFHELFDMNYKRWEGKMPNENMNSILLVTRFGGPKLFTCWPMGKVEERTYTSIGSGSDYALNYLMNQDKLIPGRISLPENLDLNVNALHEAFQDLYTGGLDLVAFTKEGVYPLGERINRKINEAKISEIEEIKKLSKKF